MKLVFDFGHAAEATKINVSNIVLKNHADDDGTKVPADGPGGGDDTPKVNWVAVDSPDNLGAGFNTKGEMGFWWADAGWGQIGDPGFSYADGVYTVTAVENGGSEWQAQCSITGVPLKIEKSQIVQNEPIKQFGSYQIKCKLGNGISGVINVMVTEEK